MDSYEVCPEFKPCFSLGQQVWYITDGIPAVDSSTVRSICFELLPHRVGKPLLACVGYKLAVMHVGAADHETFLPFELFESESVARENAVWHPVTGISEQEWLTAIGQRDGEQICELGSCCPGILDTRDLLIKCRTNGGLRERDARRIVGLLKTNAHADILDLKDQPKPVLTRIFAQLGIRLVKRAG